MHKNKDKNKLYDISVPLFCMQASEGDCLTRAILRARVGLCSFATKLKDF